MREYQLGNFAKFFGYAFSGGILVGAFFSLKAALESTSEKSELIFHLVTILCVALAIFLTREIKISRFVITVDRVYLVSMIYKRTLYLEQIRGWREAEQEIHILPKDPALKKIRVSTYFKNSDEIRYFLSEHFPNLDATEAYAEEQKILEDESFGATPEARALRLGQARTAARYTNWGGWAIAAWMFMYPYPYTLSIVAGAIYPMLAIGVCFIYHGLICGDESKNSAYPSVVSTVILVPIVLALRVLLDVNTLSYLNGWVLMAIIAVAVFALYQIPTRGFSFDRNSKYVPVFLLPVFTFSYGFGVVAHMNTLGDDSDPVAYQTVVKHKRVSSGKTRTYHLELRKWGDLKEDEEVDVTRSMYEGTAVGDSITVYQYPGLLNMPWVLLE